MLIFINFYYQVSYGIYTKYCHFILESGSSILKMIIAIATHKIDFLSCSDKKSIISY